MLRSLPRRIRCRQLTVAAAACSAAAAGVLVAVSPAGAVSPDVVISEVYGGGGNSGALLKRDFIELYNRSTTPVSLAGWSVQYASATGSSWQTTALSGSIEPGAFLLVGEAAGSAGTVDLPVPDVSGGINMSGSAGKVALVTSTAALSECDYDPDSPPPPCSGLEQVYDFVGYGAANDFEGTGPAPYASGNNSSATRDAVGTDTDDNAADFDVLSPPSPTNAAGETAQYPPPDPCEGGTPVPATIEEIQGAGHLSTFDTACVDTSGVATARSSNGYWIQTPDAEDDDSQLTSAGIFVFTGAGGTKPLVGDAVDVIGIVDEFRPGSSSGPGLNITEITGAIFTVTASGVALPTPVLIGPAGVRAPEDVIDNDSPTRIDIEVLGQYQPQEDAIDWYEQFEGMLVQVNDPTAVGPTNNFGEIVVLPRGRNDYVRTPNRGVVYSGYDMPNPRRLLLDDLLIGAGNMPDVDTGDRLDGLVTGPLDYGFNNYRMYPMTVPVAAAGDAQREVTGAQKTEEVAVASFNVENLDPSDSAEKFAALAGIIVDNLRAPDILALEEVQDNNGAVNDEVVDASVTLDQLVNAIAATGGPTYDYRQINPQDDQDGGEPGGNIRVAFLFRTDRGIAFVDRAPGDATTPTQPILIDGEVALDHSPGRVDPNNPAWEATRKPLAGEFTWNDQKLIVIANHFSSKGGDEPLFGRWQPPTRSSESKRHEQAASVNAFVEEILALDPAANVVVAGDINDFEFSETIDILTDDGAVLADLVQYLGPRQRYTYVFEGNSQVLDHLLVSPALAPVTSPEQRPVKTRRDYDIVHVNADFFDQVSDHDPQVVRLRLQPAA